eukprot:5702836-Lingulodinium_polyedra.AAC.1
MGLRAECASVRCASRCGSEASVQPHHCAAFCKRCATTRSNRRRAETGLRMESTRVQRDIDSTASLRS